MREVTIKVPEKRSIVKIIIGGIAAVFLLIGIVFMLVNIPIYHQQNKMIKNGAVKTDGEIIDVTDGGRAKILFTVDGEEYICDTGSYTNSSFSVGDSQAVYYYKDNPQHCRVQMSMIFKYVFGGIGLFFAVLGAVMLLVVIIMVHKDRNHIDMLKE